MKILKVVLITVIIIVAVAALALFGVYKSKNVELKDLSAADRQHAGGSFIELTKGTTHYQLSGPDTGKVVVLIHGFSVPYFIWDGTYEYLVKQGFRVLRYDMYGRGFSDRPHVVYNRDLYNQQLLDLIAQLHLKTPVNIAGISFGGELATDFTATHPEMVKKLILIDPGYNTEAPSAPAAVTNYYEATHPDERANGQLTDFKYPGKHPNWVMQYRVQMQYKGFRYALVSTLYNYRHFGRESNTALNSVHKPVLLIWGKEDQTVPFRYSDSVRSVLKTEFFPVDDARHLPFLEQPNLVNPKIAEFFRK